MTRTDIDVPVPMLASYTAVAALAAVGLISMMPVSAGSGLTAVGVAVFTPLMAAGLVMVGHRAVVEARDSALKNATVDSETGLSTPFAAERALETEFAAAQRGRPLTLVMIRLEQFPQYTAKHGRGVACTSSHIMAGTG